MVDSEFKGYDGQFRLGIDIKGRPDLGFGHDKDWGIVFAKKYPKYIHSTNGNSLLIHKIACVKISWYSGNYDYMRHLDKPRIYAETVCNRHIFLSGKKAGKSCEIPDLDAVLCGTCHGELPTFSKRRKDLISRQWAKDHLGCKGLHEVIGTYRQPEGA